MHFPDPRNILPRKQANIPRGIYLYITIPRAKTKINYY